METSTASKVNQVISDLEILKEKIASITSRYNILNEDYSRLCEDAISIIAEYCDHEASTEHLAAISAPAAGQAEIDTAESNVEAADPVPYNGPQPAGCPSGDTAIPFIEQKFAAELTPAGESLDSMEGLEVKISRTPSLEEIIAFQHREMWESSTRKNTGTGKKKINAQAVVDIIGDGIEYGLDRIGNGLMFPFVKISELSQKHSASRQTNKT